VTLRCRLMFSSSARRFFKYHPSRTMPPHTFKDFHLVMHGGLSLHCGLRFSFCVRMMRVAPSSPSDCVPLRYRQS
jgi:hypothetical protein